MTTDKDGGPAFPTRSINVTKGMSLRDYFAGQALAGTMARDDVKANSEEVMPELQQFLAKHCYAMADAMLAARSAKP
jgi:hypothetical protein